MRSLFATLVVLLLVFCLVGLQPYNVFAQSTNSGVQRLEVQHNADRPVIVPGQYILTMSAGMSDIELKKFESDYQFDAFEFLHRSQTLRLLPDGTRQIDPAKNDYIRVKTKPGSTDDTTLLARLRVDQRVRYAELDAYVYLDEQPGGPYLANQLVYFKGINIIPVWDRITRAPDVVEVVLDTGKPNHPDLNTNINAKLCFNLITNTADATDGNGHSTFVSYTIAGIGDNNEGGTGVVFSSGGTSVVCYKMLNDQGSGVVSDGVKGIYRAIGLGDSLGKRIVINISWGTSSYVQSLLQSLTDANAKGIIVVCAGGNLSQDNRITPHYPAAFSIGGKLKNVISVAALYNNQVLADFSNYGTTLAVPGVGIIGAYLNGEYRQGDGTSFSTPLVTGVTALMLEAGVPPDQIYDRLLMAVTPLASLNGKVDSGGILDADKALADVGNPAVITGVNYAKANKLMTISVTGLRTGQAVMAKINGKTVKDKFVTVPSELNRIEIRASTKKLFLKRGSNEIIVITGGLSSAPFTFNY